MTPFFTTDTLDPATIPRALRELSPLQWQTHLNEVITATVGEADITDTERDQLQDVILQYADTFTSEVVPLGATNTVKHRIELSGDPAPQRKPLRLMGPTREEVSREKLQQLLDSDSSNRPAAHGQPPS